MDTIKLTDALANLTARVNNIDGLSLPNPAQARLLQLAREDAGLRTTIRQVTLVLEANLKDLSVQVTNLQTIVDKSLGALNVANGPAPLNVNFVDGEVPKGTIDGRNPSFTLSFAPSPQVSLQLYRNGLLLALGVDYLLSGNTITFLAGAIPQAGLNGQPGDSLLAIYRY